MITNGSCVFYSFDVIFSLHSFLECAKILQPVAFDVNQMSANLFNQQRL